MFSSTPLSSAARRPPSSFFYLQTRAADPSTLPDVISVLDDLEAAGITVVRTWAFADGPQWIALQPSPGVFNEYVFRGLDRVIAEAGARGIRILFNLINFWSDYGGMAQYVTWSRQARGVFPQGQEGVEEEGSAEKKEHHQQASQIACEFYQDPWCQSMFQNFIKTLLLRKNTITNILYRDDPTILGWAPANEPQCLCDPGCRGSVIATWAHETAAEIKKVDPNHLVFMDCEGFWGPSSSLTCQASISCSSTGGNPYDCSYNGCDFIADCASPYIDVACIHLYPDLWLPDASEKERVDFAAGSLDAHVDACAQVLRKPLTLSEFGKLQPKSSRKLYFQTMYSKCFDHMEQRRFLAGSMFWTAAAASYPDYDGFTIYLPQKKGGERQDMEGDDAAEVIKEHAVAVQKLNEKCSNSSSSQGLGGGRRKEEETSKRGVKSIVSKTKEKLGSKLEMIKKKFSF